MAVFMDTESWHSLLFYEKGDPNPDFGFKHLFANNTFGKFKSIDNKGIPLWHGTPYSVDGKHIFLMYHTFRDRSLKERTCEEADKGGCLEIDFTESKDGGLTWSAPVLMQRSNMNDAASRFAASVVFVKETGRLYLFYVKQMNGQDQIAFVTRPPGSITFSPEKIVLQTYYRQYVPGATYTMKANKPIIHLVYPVDEGKIMYAYSENAIEWKNPIVIANKVINCLPLISNSDVSNGTLFFGYVDNEEIPYLLTSEDHGVKWSAPFKASNKPAFEGDLDLCGTPQNQKLFFVAADRALENVFSIYDPLTKKITFEKPPFGNMKMGYPSVSCGKLPTGNKYKVIVEADNDGDSSVYVSTNEYNF
jgi:hypothetical protein